MANARHGFPPLVIPLHLLLIRSPSRFLIWSFYLNPQIETLEWICLSPCLICTAIVYFKLYESQVPVIDRAIETAALMLGSDRSRGYCLEMICADFLAGANMDNGDPETLLFSMTGFFRCLPERHKRAFLDNISEKAS